MPLPDDEVHIWRAWLDQPSEVVQELHEVLDGDERGRAERFRFERDRRRFVVGRGRLRLILGRYLSAAPADLRFAYGAHGKPTVAGAADGRPLCFNVSHSDALAVYAVTRGRQLGVDVEAVRPMPDAEQLAARFFSPRENAAWRALGPGDKPAAFFRCWTRKEAFLKATGQGLAQPLDAFDVTLAPEAPARLLYVAGDPEAAARWTLRDLAPAAGYVAALAVEGQGWRLVE